MVSELVSGREGDRGGRPRSRHTASAQELAGATSGSTSSRPPEASRGDSRPAMSESSNGLHEATRSRTLRGRRAADDRQRWKQAGPPSISATTPGLAHLVARRKAPRVRSAARALSGGPAPGMPRSTSQTPTAATFTSSRAMRTTSTASPGLPTGGDPLRQGEPQGIYIIGADGRNNHRLTRDSPLPVLRSPGLVARRTLDRLRHRPNR